MKLNELYKLNPYELYRYIKENITYGFVDKNNNKYFPKNFEKIDIDKLYVLQNPALLLQNNCGDCWDVVELYRNYLNYNNIYNETYYIEYLDEKLKIHNTHTFIVYNKDDIWYNIEDNSSNNENGIFEYKDKTEVIETLTNCFRNWIEQDYTIKITEDNFTCKQYLKPVFEISSIEFQKWCKE
ncbi:MAG: hypothetical protein PHD15_05055 [Clostridia bacterium]|nr:hypothetical protein [Clostridia bacterium]MDD4387102.1 hypothetical protein [Clostridia bacterium]